MRVGIVNQMPISFRRVKWGGPLVGVQGQMSLALETHYSRLNGLPMRQAVFLQQGKKRTAIFARQARSFTNVAVRGNQCFFKIGTLKFFDQVSFRVSE